LHCIVYLKKKHLSVVYIPPNSTEIQTRQAEKFPKDIFPNSHTLRRTCILRQDTLHSKGTHTQSRRQKKDNAQMKTTNKGERDERWKTFTFSYLKNLKHIVISVGA
jgi:hypothetical protein